MKAEANPTRSPSVTWRKLLLQTSPTRALLQSDSPLCFPQTCEVTHSFPQSLLSCCPSHAVWRQRNTAASGEPSTRAGTGGASSGASSVAPARPAGLCGSALQPWGLPLPSRCTLSLQMLTWDCPSPAGASPGSTTRGRGKGPGRGREDESPGPAAQPRVGSGLSAPSRRTSARRWLQRERGVNGKV